MILGFKNLNLYDKLHPMHQHFSAPINSNMKCCTNSFQAFQPYSSNLSISFKLRYNSTYVKYFSKIFQTVAYPEISYKKISNRGIIRASENGNDPVVNNTSENISSFVTKNELSSISLDSTLNFKNSPNKLSGGDMMKLFNDAQQNMLFLNKQRLLAMEELSKVERDKEFLLAKVSELQAINQSEIAQREILEQRIKNLGSNLELAESKKSSIFESVSKNGKLEKYDPPTVWSAISLKLDSLFLESLIDQNQVDSLRNLVQTRDYLIAELFEEAKEWNDSKIAKHMLSALDYNTRKGIHVVHICTELFPIAKVSSFSKWITGLCRSLRRKHHLVEVILPKYESMDLSHIDSLKELKTELFSFFGGDWHRNKIWNGLVYGIPITLIEPLHPVNFFSREKIYDYEDDFERFTYFSRAALEYISKSGKHPDTIHLHNSHTAICAPLFWEIYANKGMQNTRLLFTCHDFKHQLVQDSSALSLIGLDANQLNRPDRLQDNIDPSKINLLKGGIVYSNKVTTLSPLYASDAKSNSYGRGIETTLGIHQSKFVGLLTGLDENEWCPSNDPSIPVPFDSNDISGKIIAKSQLRQRLNLQLIDPEIGSERPLVVCLAPQVSESEIDLVKSSVSCVLDSNAQFVFIGSSSSPRVQNILEEMQRDTMGDNLQVILKYEDSIVHLSVAAADILLCPPFYDPSGILPLIGMKYGAIPVARQLRSQADCLIDVDDGERGNREGVGFFFFSNRVADLQSSIARAIERWISQPESWALLMDKAMKADYSWNSKSVEAYIDAYHSLKKIN